MNIQPEAIIARYKREKDLYEKLARGVYDRCQAAVRDNAMRATLQWRVKDESRLEEKIQRQRELMSRTKFRSNEPTSVEEWLATFNDLAAVRVITYEESDRVKAATLVAERFTDEFGSGHASPTTRDKANIRKGTFYRATHLHVTIPDKELINTPLANLKGVVCEIQVCSMLAHVWNEIEHDLVYKRLSGTPSESEMNLLKALGNETMAGDSIISELIKATNNRTSKETDAFVDVYDFVARARTMFPEAENFGRNAGQLFAQLRSFGVSNMKYLIGILGNEPQERGARILADLDSALEPIEAASLKLDASSSDVALMCLLEQKAQEIVDAYPSGRGVGRPPRIASIARRYLLSRDGQI